MKVAIVFDPLPDIGPDPNDEHQSPRRLGEFVGDNSDCLVIYREWGDQFEDGYRTHILAQGIYENIPDDQWEAVLAELMPAL